MAQHRAERAAATDEHLGRTAVALVRQHGRLRWARLFEPAIALAERGFAVSPRLHTLLAAEKALPADPVASAYFYRADGAPHPVGHVLRNPELAHVLGAKPPYRIPKWLGRLVTGEAMTVMMTEVRGASNAKAKRELGWQLRYPSWRLGITKGLG